MLKPCKWCNRQFSRRSHLNRHLKTIHGVEREPLAHSREQYNYKCLEDVCDSSFKRNEDLIYHLENYHELEIIRRNLEFEDINGKK